MNSTLLHCAAAALAAALIVPQAFAQQRLAVTITDDGLALSAATAKPGPVTFAIRNDAAVPYEVEIEGPGLDYDSRDIAPGGSLSVTLELRPGRYEIEAESEEGPDREWEAYLTVRD